MTPQIGLRLVTIEPICAVRILDGLAGSITRIPRHSTLRMVRCSRLANMIEIEWQGQTFAAFEADIQERCAAAGSEPGRPYPMRQARIA